MKKLVFLPVWLVIAVLIASKTAAQGEPLAPDAQPGEIYFAPFPLTIILDGDLGDWAGVPTVSMSRDDAGVTFAGAANGEYLYFMADVLDAHIIAGQHEADYWNEDSVEFYLNGTGDLTLTSYVPGVAQITISPVNIDLPVDQHIVAGVQGDTVGATFEVVKTDTGWATEVAIPLRNDVWEITPEHGAEIGFQVHLNAASELNRDTKLIWSIFDTSDQSYQNPRLFGRLSFFEIGGEPVVVETPETAEPTPVPAPVLTGPYESGAPWELVWSDEFNAAASTPINSEHWTCETGGQGWGNQEWEYYTDRTENVVHDGEGNLSIIARAEALPDSECWYGECTHTSARCITQGKFAFTYGRVEARMKLPYGQGIWPAFWMLGANVAEAGWPDSGEIDIMEFIGREPQTTYATVHGPGYSGAAGIGKSFNWGEDVSNEYHIWSVEWEPNVIRWYVDNLEFRTITPEDLPAGRQWVYDHDFFILLNLAVGGTWPGYPDETTLFPQTFSIDWVRVFQRAAP